MEKKKYYNGKISECAGDSKKMLEIINSIPGKCCLEIKSSFMLDDCKITDPRVIANEFNKYFTPIASKLNENYMIESEMSL